MLRWQFSLIFVLTTTFISVISAAGPFDKNVDRLMNSKSFPACEDESGRGRDLCVTISSDVERQIVILNTSAYMAVILNPETEQFAALNNNGHGVFYDRNMDLGFETKHGYWFENLGHAASKIHINKVIEDLEPIQVSKIRPNDPFYLIVKEVFQNFGSDIKKTVKELGFGDAIFSFIKSFFTPVCLIKNALKAVTNVVFKGWVALKGGIINLLDMFTSLDKFVAGITGGVTTLVKAAVFLPLELIIGAANGVAALATILKTFISNLDLTKILSLVIACPVCLAKIIYGLGGKVLKGITGLFNIVGNLLEFIASIALAPIFAITKAVIKGLRSLFKLIFSYCSESPMRPYEVQKLQADSDDMLSLVKIQDQKFQNRAQMKTFEQFFKATKGEGKFEVHGINIGAIIVTLTKEAARPAVDLVTKIIHLLKPIMPLSFVVPEFITSLLGMSSRSGIEAIKNLMPDVDLDGVNLGTSRSLPVPSDTNMTNVELIENNPIASKIYRRIQQSLEPDNVNLPELLNSDNVATAELKDELLKFNSRY